MDQTSTIRDHTMFRIILKGMSHPGKVYCLPVFTGEGPSIADLLGCLMDNEVCFAVIDDRNLETVLARHTNSRQASSEEADYIFASKGTTLGKLGGFKRGSLEYPDTGATIIYLVEELIEAKGGIVLSGPGVKGTASLRITGLDPGELQLLREANSEFPLGVDAIFLDRGGNIACIPRSSQIGVN